VKPRTARSRTITRRLALGAIPVAAAGVLIGITVGPAQALEPANQCLAWSAAQDYYWNEYTSLAYEADQAEDEGNYIEEIVIEEAESIALDQFHTYYGLVSQRC
jgi:hypothetical protein